MIKRAIEIFLNVGKSLVPRPLKLIKSIENDQNCKKIGRFHRNFSRFPQFWKIFPFQPTNSIIPRSKIGSFIFSAYLVLLQASKTCGQVCSNCENPYSSHIKTLFGKNPVKSVSEGLSSSYLLKFFLISCIMINNRRFCSSSSRFGWGRGGAKF